MTESESVMSGVVLPVKSRVVRVGWEEIDLLIDLSAFTIHYSITAFSLKYAFIASNIFPAASICSAASSFDAI